MPTMYTIGYRRKPLATFIGQLCEAGVDAVIDVRLRNTSHLAGYTKQDTLDFLLREGFGISYEHHPELAPTAEIFDAYRDDGDWLAYETHFLPLLGEQAAEKVGHEILDLVVTAINVQYEMGGNLAQTLDTIGDTVRDRIRILREIQVLTAQQRFTGYVLAVWPLVVGFAIFLINPGYANKLFQPGMRWLPAMAVVMQVLGFLAIRKIVDIEV